MKVGQTKQLTAFVQQGVIRRRGYRLEPHAFRPTNPHNPYSPYHPHKPTHIEPGSTDRGGGPPAYIVQLIIRTRTL